MRQPSQEDVFGAIPNFSAQHQAQNQAFQYSQPPPQQQPASVDIFDLLAGPT
jgi:hypothetical protein